ncbi:MAG: hypothetical protein CL666_14080 [Balneola sp.]|nr:hypothetical protein [Balneola sp.]|tara:strand:+ start:22907 stop:26287 length:3381 start_codon:yes stop_codon:yes gene_type:complete
MANSNSHTSTDKVKQILRKAHRSLISRKYQMVAWRSLLVIFAGVITLILAEQLFYLSAEVKTTLLSVLVGIGVIVGWRTYSAIQTDQFNRFYREFSRKSQLDELKDALDLEQNNSGNKELINAAILQSLSKVEPSRLQTKLNEFVKNTGAFRLHKQMFFASSAAFLVLAVTVFNYQNAAERTFTFWENYAKPNPYSYTVSPGDQTFEQGSEFQAEIKFEGDRIPEDVSMKIKTSVEENFRDRGMEASANSFRSIPMEINNDLEYYIEMDGYQSERFRADVQLRPRFTELQATIIPPDYTRLDSSIVSYPMSQIRAYQGSTLKLTGSLNKEVAYLQLYTKNELLDLFINEDSTFSYELPVKEKDTLRFHIEDANGLVNQNPFQVVINPSEDEYPLAEIVEPEENLKEVNPQDIQLLYRASDDFGLTAARLHYELKRAFSENPQQNSISLDLPSEEALNSYIWDLEGLDLKPRDELTFWITVQDNDGYNGYKSSTSQKMVLRVPSMVDYFEDVDQKENEVSDELDEISETFEQSRQQYEQFKEMMKDNPENPGYEEKRELEQVEKQQQEIQKKVDELNKKFEELKKELSKDNMLSEETRKAYEELEKLMKEIDDPAFREAMEKLQEELGNMNPEQLREAMENMEFNEELYRERLERTMELFKQLKLKSDLDKLATSFEDMARKEADSTKTDEELQQTKEENEKLSEQTESLSENASEKNQKQVEEYQKEIQERLEEMNKAIEQQMSENAESKEQSGEQQEGGQQQNSGEKQKSDDQSQSRQQQYQQMAQQTRQMMQSMSQQQLNVNIAGLQYVLQSLLTLSLEQEDLTTLVASTENRSQAYVSYARDQRNVESIFRTISDSLFQLSAEIPQFSNQINKKKEEVEQRLQRSLEQMSERNQSQSSVASRQALGGINDISFMLANLLEQLQNQQNGEGSGGGSGNMSMQQMMEQLQQSGQQQQQLNQQLQEMINDMQGERLQQEQMERLNQIAKQQNQIRKQLQELQRQGGMEGDRLGSELERMIEDMEDTINDLRGGAADPMMIERQQNILSRMLQAEQAMQERDEEDKREGQEADQFERATPPELTLEELEKEIRNRLNDPNFTKYSEDYQRLIEKYFELLKDIQDRAL